MESESLLDGREILVKVGEDHGDDHKRDLQRLIAEAWAKAEEKYYPQGYAWRATASIGVARQAMAG